MQKMDLAVFLALVAGCSKVGEITEHCGHSAFRVREALGRLRAEGLAVRVDYRTWGLGVGGHETFNALWVSYVELFAGRPEAHEMIASTVAEAHDLIALGGGPDGEAHEMGASSARFDRLERSLMHDDDHACMDDAYSFGNMLADSADSLRSPPAGSDESARYSLEEELMEIGFDRPGVWLKKESVSWDLVSEWLCYVNGNGGIRNKAGFVRRQVESGERPNLVKAKRKQVPAEYEHLIRR